MKKYIMVAMLSTVSLLAACDNNNSTTHNEAPAPEAEKPAAVAQPSVIAHRGASGYLSEHTLAAYQLAIKMGADYIEPDLQLTLDNELVAMHDETLERTTNIAELFDKRNDGYKVADFTLSEIKTLTVLPKGTAKESYPGFTPGTANPFDVPTFQEVIDFVKQQETVTKREIGIYPEAKQADPLMEDAIIEILSRNNYTANSKVFIQSFSDTTLRSIRGKEEAQNNKMPQIVLGVAVMGDDGIARIQIVQDKKPLLAFNEVTSFAEGISLLINNKTYPITKEYIAQAHAAGLKVHGWTFAQNDPVAAAAEYKNYLDMGMDAMFSNYPDLAVKARDLFVQNQSK